MKKSLVVLALMAALSAQAQDSTSTSGSQSGSASTSNAVGNTNEATAQSGAQSASGARADSVSGAAGNVVNIDQSGPSSQTINANTTVSGSTTENVNVHNSGSTTTKSEVHYSGSQTVKNVPGIAMSGPASGPCTGVSGGLGLAGPGWGVGLNGAKVDPSCVLRENIRVTGMAMQSLDGAAYPKEKEEIRLMMMDQLRGLNELSIRIIDHEVGKPK